MDAHSAQVHLVHRARSVASVALAERRDILSYMEIVAETRSVGRLEVADEKISFIFGGIIPRACCRLRAMIDECDELLGYVAGGQS